MLEYLKKEANLTETENGAVTYKSTNSECLDLFAIIGALRREPDIVIKKRFSRAYYENPDIAMKILFFARDIRGGLGERRVFRVILDWLKDNAPESLHKNIKYIPEFGRYDDMLELLTTNDFLSEIISFIEKQLEEDKANLNENKPISLLAKWLPSVNASSTKTKMYAGIIASGLRLSKAGYRKLLSSLRKYIGIIENNLRVKDYTFDYSKQPSKAMLKYRKAFIRNDGERYNAFLDSVKKGETTLHTGTLYPYEIIAPIVNANESWRGDSLSPEELASLDTTWNALEDFTNGENAIVVADGSGSMYSYRDDNSKIMPGHIAQSLAIYFAERNTGAFHNHFITFSQRPKLIEIKGKTIADKVRYCMSFDECANTNLMATFDLILQTAIKNNLKQEDLPTKMFIISDMEFDNATGSWSFLGGRKFEDTNFEVAKAKFEAAGYKLPTVIFWNVASRNMQQPVTMKEDGVVLVSGFTPRLFQMITGDKLSPYAFMMDTLSSERYSCITA